MTVSQVQPVHIRLGEPWQWCQWDFSQQQLPVARWLCDDETQVGCGRVRVGELQVFGSDDFHGPVLQPEPRVAVQGGGDAVTMLDAEVEGTAARRVTIADNETEKTKLHLVKSV